MLNFYIKTVDLFRNNLIISISFIYYFFFYIYLFIYVIYLLIICLTR